MPTKNNDFPQINLINIDIKHDINDSFSNFNVIINQNSIAKGQIINNIKKGVLNGKINLSNIINEEKNNFLIRDDNIIYGITTSNNKNKTKNISTINLGNCENILKDTYNIDENLPLVIFKVEYFMEGLLIPVIGYEFFHPLNQS